VAGDAVIGAPELHDRLAGELAAILRRTSTTALLVTHDRAEAAELGEAIALMLEGRIVQQGPPRELFERPASAAAARFFGMANLLRGTVAGGAIEVAGASIPAPGPDGPAALVIRPEHVVLDDGAALVATVEEAVYAGTHVRLRLRRGEQRLEAHVPPASAPPAGADVGLELPLERLWRLPGDDDLASVRAGGSAG
jgi:ABC-type Fe3+/spermidine/putrescine transport system ATPase subunit